MLSHACCCPVQTSETLYISDPHVDDCSNGKTLKGRNFEQDQDCSADGWVPPVPVSTIHLLPWFQAPEANTQQSQPVTIYDGGDSRISCHLPAADVAACVKSLDVTLIRTSIVEHVRAPEVQGPRC